MSSCGSPPMSPRSGGSLSGQSLSPAQTRHVERAVPCSVARQHHCYRLQLLERQFFRLTHIGPVQLALPRAIGAPVRSPTLVACSLFVRCKAAVLTTKGEGRGGLEPGIPVGGVHHHLSATPVPQVSAEPILDHRRVPSHRSLPLL